MYFVHAKKLFKGGDLAVELVNLVQSQSSLPSPRSP